jgi:hypothetical protein
MGGGGGVEVVVDRPWYTIAVAVAAAGIGVGAAFDHVLLLLLLLETQRVVVVVGWTTTWDVVRPIVAIVPVDS